MREIRFRAWIKNDRRMIEWFPQFFADTSPVTSYGDDFPENDDNVVLMQYTGIKDENGRGIYEGDILNTADGNMVVEWDPDGQWVINDPGIGLRAPLWKWAKVGAVIGNIYENADLLK